MKKRITLLVCFLTVFNLIGQTKLALVFADHMVLQRSSDVMIWGNDTPKTPIKIEASWGQKAQTITNEQGYWQVKINTTKAGGPYEMNVTGTQKVVVKDILLGVFYGTHYEIYNI